MGATYVRGGQCRPSSAMANQSSAEPKSQKVPLIRATVLFYIAIYTIIFCAIVSSGFFLFLGNVDSRLEHFGESIFNIDYNYFGSQIRISETIRLT